MCGWKLTRANLAHTLAPCSPKVRFNSVLPSSLCMPSGLLPWISQPICVFLSPRMCYVPPRRIVLDLLARQTRMETLKPLFAVLLSYFVLFTVSFSLAVDSEQCNIEYKVQRIRRKRPSFV
jgi:hypothetical protein